MSSASTSGYILIAFKRYRNIDGLWGSAWVGFKNFRFLFGVSDKGWQITRNVLAYNLVSMVLGLIVSVTIAVLISEIYKSFAAKFYRTALLFPHFFSWVVVGYIAFAFFDHDTGMLNGLLERLGFLPVAWYHEPQYWPFILILTNLWKGLGMSTILYLSGILRINPEYYEVAAMDGATKFQQAIHITIPLLVPLMKGELDMRYGYTIQYSNRWYRLRERLGRWAMHAALIIISLACFAPFVLVISASLSGNQAILDQGYRFWPVDFSLDAYRYLLLNPKQLINSYKVSIMITVAGTLLGLGLTSMLAYTMSRRNFKLRNVCAFLIYFPMLFSGGLVPFYILMTQYLHLKDNLWALILPGLINGWSVLILRTYFSGLSEEILDAARVDGAASMTLRR